MKKQLFIYFSVLTALVLVGCAENFDLNEPMAVESQQAVATFEPLTRSVDGAIYNEVTDSWMIHRADPFTLTNVQAAYDRLAAKQSAQSLTLAEADKFKVGEKLAPTHYALKIYPKNEEEQWRVEMMKDVNVAYIPFNYSQLTQEEVEKVEQNRAKTQTSALVFAEKSPYTVTYDNYESTDGGPTTPLTSQLPILYVVWPADKPFPTDLEYVVDYPVFLPELHTEAQADKNVSVRTAPAMANLNTETNALFREAIALSNGWDVIPAKASSIRSRANEWGSAALGCLTTYDNILKKYVPLSNLWIVIRYGSYTLAGGPAIADGHFWIPFFSWPDDTIPDPMPLTVEIKYTNAWHRYKITTNNSTVPYITSVLANFDKNWSDTTWITLTSSTRQENEIHRAANYFFRDQTDIAVPPYGTLEGLRIIANDPSVSTAYKGAFSYSFPDSCVINIYNRGHLSADVIGTTLHELGHFAHFKSVGYNTYTSFPKFLRESFASYSGWYFGEKYYISQGATRPGNGYWTITGNERQDWHKTYSSTSIIRYYSPLFIDLTDTYNQKRTSTSIYPNDGIQGVPASVIWNIVSTSTTWAQCRAKLQSYVGTYYTSTAFNNWIADFDYWFAQTSNQPF
jgi:hypothetical protein